MGVGENSLARSNFDLSLRFRAAPSKMFGRFNFWRGLPPENLGFGKPVGAALDERTPLHSPDAIRPTRGWPRK